MTPGDGSFWDVYRTNPGVFASPGAVAKHAAAKGGWDANAWNSARCDTAEVSIFAFQSRGVLGGPGDSKVWVNYLHESDPRFAALGQLKPRCYIRTLTSDPNDVVCDGTVPSVRGVQRYRCELRLNRLCGQQHVHPGVHEDDPRRLAHCGLARRVLLP